MSDINGNGTYEAPPGFGEYDDLDNYGSEAAPQHAFRPNLDTVSDGDYDCEITDARLDRINNDRVCRVGLKLLSAGGRVVEHTYWLNRQQGVNGFLAEMAALGFPAHKWGGNPGQTPLSTAIPDCVAKLKGIKFRAAKSSRTDNKANPPRKYHELHIGGRLAGAPMPPNVPPQVAAPRPALGAGQTSDIPF